MTSSRKTSDARSGTRRAPVRKDVNVEQTLRDAIATQQYPPGSKLRENDLAEQYGVSRAVVREAFSVLAQRGLIERIPNRGAVVSRLDYAQVAEIFTVREALEGLCAREAAAKSRPQDWDEFVLLLDGPMPLHLEQGDFESFLACYERFRRRVIEAADNQLLSGMLDSISEKIIFLSRRIILLPGRAEQALQEHRLLLDALRRGDADAAEAQRKQTMRNGWKWFDRYHRFLM